MTGNADFGVSAPTFLNLKPRGGHPARSQAFQMALMIREAQELFSLRCVAERGGPLFTTAIELMPMWWVGKFLRVWVPALTLTQTHTDTHTKEHGKGKPHLTPHSSSI